MKIEDILKKQGEYYKNLASYETVQTCNKTIEKPKPPIQGELVIHYTVMQHPASTRYENICPTSNFIPPRRWSDWISTKVIYFPERDIICMSTDDIDYWDLCEEFYVSESFSSGCGHSLRTDFAKKIQELKKNEAKIKDFTRLENPDTFGKINEKSESLESKLCIEMKVNYKTKHEYINHTIVKDIVFAKYNPKTIDNFIGEVKKHQRWREKEREKIGWVLNPPRYDHLDLRHINIIKK